MAASNMSKYMDLRAPIELKILWINVCSGSIQVDKKPGFIFYKALSLYGIIYIYHLHYEKSLKSVVILLSNEYDWIKQVALY